MIPGHPTTPRTDVWRHIATYTKQRTVDITAQQHLAKDRSKYTIKHQGRRSMDIISDIRTK